MLQKPAPGASPSPPPSTSTSEQTSSPPPSIPTPFDIGTTGENPRTLTSTLDALIQEVTRKHIAVCVSHDAYTHPKFGVLAPPHVRFTAANGVEHGFYGRWGRKVLEKMEGAGKESEMGMGGE